MERQRDLDRAREAEARYRALLDGAADRAAVLTLDPAGRVTGWSAGARDLLGWDEAEALGMDGRLTFTPEDRARGAPEAGMAAAAAEGRVREERWCLRKDGGRFWASSLLVPLRDAPSPGFLGVVRDRAAERDAAEALRESEERYRTLVETSPDAVHVHRDGVIILANRQAAALFGAAGPEDLVGRRALSLVDEASLGLARERTGRLSAPGRRNEVVELTLRRLDGTAVVAEAASAAVLLDGRLAVQAVLRDVTARKLAEAELRRSEEQRRLALEAAGLGVWDLDYATGRLDCDARFRQMYGLAPGERVAGRDLWERVHPDDAPRVRAAVERARSPASDGAYEAEYRAVLPGGAERWHLAKAQVHFEGDGGARRPARLVGVVTDVTGRRRAEAALAEGEERLRLAVEATGLGIFDVDPVSGARRWSDEYKAILGLPPDARPDPELQAALIHPEDRGWVSERYWASYRGEGGGLYDAEYRVLRAGDGAERWVHNTGRVHFDAAGRAVRGIGTLLDVTGRKRTEAALRESEERYRATQEHAGVGIGEVDADGRFLRVNAAVCAITGYDREELLGRTVFDVTHPDDAREERADYARLVAGEAATYAREKRYVRRDGAERWVEVAATAVRDREGRFLYGVRVVQDVTDRKLAEARQRLLLDELNHRVKNTLAVVRSIAAQTVTADRPPAEASDALAQRLRALAAAHDLLTGSGWRGARLRALAAAELAPYAGRFSAEGDDLTLGPKAALTLGLALHELATNAAKHGALSAPDGRVEVAWGLEGDGAGAVFRLGWRELGGPPVAPPTRRGFGRRLIEQGLRHDLGGDVVLSFLPEGLACELRAPAAAALAG